MVVPSKTPTTKGFKKIIPPTSSEEPLPCELLNILIKHVSLDSSVTISIWSSLISQLFF